jgi:hypothetical protein
MDNSWCLYCALEKLVGEGPELEAGTKKDADPKAGIEKVVDRVAEDLDMDMRHARHHQYADAWLQDFAGHSDFMGVASEYGRCGLLGETPKGEDTKEPVQGHFAHGAVAKDGMSLSFFDKIVESLDSEIGWSEIGTETENGDWSEDDLGA